MNTWRGLQIILTMRLNMPPTSTQEIEGAGVGHNEKLGWAVWYGGGTGEDIAAPVESIPTPICKSGKRAPDIKRPATAPGVKYPG